MKNVVKLNERDLTRIIHRVISEQVTTPTTTGTTEGGSVRPCSSDPKSIINKAVDYGEQISIIFNPTNVSDRGVVVIKPINGSDDLYKHIPPIGCGVKKGSVNISGGVIKIS